LNCGKGTRRTMYKTNISLDRASGAPQNDETANDRYTAVRYLIIAKATASWG